MRAKDGGVVFDRVHVVEVEAVMKMICVGRNDRHWQHPGGENYWNP